MREDQKNLHAFSHLLCTPVVNIINGLFFLSGYNDHSPALSGSSNGFIESVPKWPWLEPSPESVGVGVGSSGSQVNNIGVR